MKKKVLILGASGMAGHIVFTLFKENGNYDVLGTSNSNNFDAENKKLNIYEQANLINIIEDFQPDFIINCIGILIKGSKDAPDNTIYANSYFPNFLARLSKEKKFKLIHISTDCVFTGKDGQYKEDSFKDARDVYGNSKALGEIVDDTNLTIRTSIIGPEIKTSGEGLFHWFMQQDGEITGFKSNIWSGVTTLELAKFILWVLDKKFTGLIHLTNNNSINKYDLLNLFKEIFSKNIIINDLKDYVCDKSFINTNKNLNYKVPSYHQMFIEQKEFMIEHSRFYPHYHIH